MCDHRVAAGKVHAVPNVLDIFEATDVDLVAVRRGAVPDHPVGPEIMQNDTTPQHCRTNGMM